MEFGDFPCQVSAQCKTNILGGIVMKKINIEVNGINVGVIKVSDCNTDKEVNDMVLNYLENKVEWDYEE